MFFSAVGTNSEDYDRDFRIFSLGAIDKKGYLIITFPSSAAIERLTGDELKKLIIYLASIK